MSRRKSTYVPQVDPDYDPLKIGSSEDESCSRSTRSNRRKSSASSVSDKKPVVIEESSEAEEELEEDVAEQEEEPARVERPRRSCRQRSPNKRYTEGFVNTAARGRRHRAGADSEEEEERNVTPLDSEDEWQMDQLAGNLKATTLFEDRLDVEGQKIFGFRTPRKRGSMSVLASSIQRTPTATTPSRRGRKSVNKLVATPKTPKTPTAADRRKSKLDLMKTPHQERSKLKKNIKKMVQHESGSDFTASDSEYVPSSEEEEDDDTQEEVDKQEDDDEEEEEEIKPKRPVVRNQLGSIGIAPGKSEPATPTTCGQRVSSRIRNRRKANLDYVLQSDDYFSSHSSSKVITSDSTLDRLKTPRLPHDQLFRLLKESRGSSEHQKVIQELHEEYESYFTKWLFLMDEGYNILLYGLGSKRNLLQSFHRKVLAGKPVIVVNGFFPTLTIKDILEAITGDLLDLNVHSGNFHELVDIIEEEFSYLPDTHLFLIVHNLDGTMLRNGKAQNILARLAKIDNIHMLASIDHINTPLIWDSSKLSYFNFSWWDVTTMLPYSDETAFENSLLVQNSGALALSSMKNVFQSLTSNSRGIFLAIVRHQLANKGNPHYPGMLFKDLYSACREAFLVSSDLALRAQLTEFIDHKLVRQKRTVDGAENLLIPIEHGLLQQFMEENEES
ncbi:origin recognition complex subunit 2 [Aedes albopictus]|uniref:Origin recognition complex subunit 2 n=1 Tax=Aedes albopictus TaxID=7160 RepID=A0ABM1YMZ1_AEDAL|nr:origin recognition complex subunit 2 [Aedes albopictus]